MKDLWVMFIKQLEKYFPNQKIYFFCDIKSKIFSRYNVIKYKKNDDFTTQYLKSLKKVKEKYIITLNEDYILYDFVKKKKIRNYINILNKYKKISFIRLHKGSNSTKKKICTKFVFFR